MMYVFTDQFAGPEGSAPNPDYWMFQPDKTDGEVQTYTDSRENSYLDGQGHLVIQAGSNGKAGITSARLATRGLQQFDWGTFTARIKIDTQLGTWPSFWLLGQESQTWPKCGEIDAFEWYGNGQWGPTSTVHTAGNNDSDHATDVILPPIDNNWHSWQVKVAPAGGVQFYMDAHLVLHVPNPGGGVSWPFGKGKPLYMLLNIAVGGAGGGNVPNPFPGAQMLVDYVHVWQ